MVSPQNPEPEPSSHQPDPALMGLFNFSIDDLKANRAGNLTPRQVQLLQDKLTDEWGCLGCFPIMMAAMFMCICVLSRTTGKSQSAFQDAGLLAMGIVGVLIMSMTTVNLIRRRQAELSQPKVKSVRGNFQLYINDAGKGRSYWLIISHMDFDIKPSLYTGLMEYLQQENRSKTYKVYYTEKTNTILSVDSLS